MTDRGMPSSIMKKIMFAPLLAMTFMFIITGVVLAEPLAQSYDGEALFNEKCKACHTIGGGDLMGPDLQGVTDRRDPAWLKQWILAPDQVLASGDPIAKELLARYKNIPMPNLALMPDQVDAILAFMGGGATVSGSTASLSPGDHVLGKAYFVGDKRFENGGPQCMSCHSVAGIGSLGGGNLGPDLTTSGYVQSNVAFAAFMGAPITQTMGAIWKNTPLTAQEQADLYAFLSKAAVTQREPGTLLQIALFSVVGAMALIGLAQVYWGKRSQGVRKPMIERTLAAKRK